MPRRLVPFVPNSYYHIYNRGNNRQPIFFEAENYLYFLQGVRKYLRPTATMVAYCLMPTHYHLLVRVESPKQTSEVLEASEISQRFSRAMQRLLISYTKAINKRFSRVGALFQGAFQARPIQEYSHLLNLCVYIHANPVKDGLTDLPEAWPYSDYADWLGGNNGAFPDAEFLRQHFETPTAYRALVMEYLRSRKLPEDVRRYLQDVEAP